MKIGILKEQKDKRVALAPATVKKLKGLGVEILVEKNAGFAAHYPDEEYAEYASVLSRANVLAEADLLISVFPPPDADLKKLKEGTALLSQFRPYFDTTVTGKLQKLKLKGFSMDMIPRTTLAQTMDLLSSMASIAGYKAVLTAAQLLPRYFPMLITAAGSIRPAKVLVLGAGVAGLQAIATAKRLGAMVEASDTRLAAKEEVESLGGKFIVVEGAKDEKTAGGYAVEQTEEFLKRQREEVQARAMKADVIITTAQVRGRKAPLLVPKSTVEKMNPGSVIVDLAASTGGNCELTKDNETVEFNGVTIVGDSELAATVTQDASFLFGNNVFNFIKVIIKDGALHLDMKNVIVAGAYFTAES